MEPIRVAVIGEHPTLWFAAQELVRVLAEMTHDAYALAHDVRYEARVRTIWIGLAKSFPADVSSDVDSSSPGDGHSDDRLIVRMRGDEGVVAGSNLRSVLMAVYAYLHRIGVVWPRPGVERIPHGAVTSERIVIDEVASYRHRCVCIEGSVGVQHARAMIDWLPKVGMNSYFNQFRDGYTFFERWRRENGGAPLTRDEAQTCADELVAEIRKRDLLLHAVGHGWTCEPFGMPGLGWDYPAPLVPAESVPMLAQVNGVRALWNGIPLNTNLCYSNSEVRRRMRDAVVEYAETHREVDFLQSETASRSSTSITT